MVVVIDSETGNFGSVINMLKKIGYRSTLTQDISIIENADKLILPGVGAFDNAIKNLCQNGLAEIIQKKADAGTPILGICLGMQLLGEYSEEGLLPGLGLIGADTKKLDNGLRVPHMGWNEITVTRENPLLSGLTEPRFYFTHSYYMDVYAPDTIATARYGLDFPCAVNKDNVWGVQFHPEKSHKHGMTVLKNYMEKI